MSIRRNRAREFESELYMRQMVIAQANGALGPDANYDMTDVGDMPPATMETMPNTPGTKRRTIRIDDPEWDAAMEAAGVKGEVLAEEIREFVRRYPKLKKRGKK